MAPTRNLAVCALADLSSLLRPKRVFIRYPLSGSMLLTEAIVRCRPVSVFFVVAIHDPQILAL
jgi:hypothetical protein